MAKLDPWVCSLTRPEFCGSLTIETRPPPPLKSHAWQVLPGLCDFPYIPGANLSTSPVHPRRSGFARPFFGGQVDTESQEESEIKLPYASHLVIRAGPEAHNWAKKLAEHCSLRLTDLIWQSLLRMADHTGFHLKVPQRYPTSMARRKH